MSRAWSMNLRRGAPVPSNFGTISVSAVPFFRSVGPLHVEEPRHRSLVRSAMLGAGQAFWIQKRMTLSTVSWWISGWPVFFDQAVTSGMAPGSVASRRTTWNDSISLTILASLTIGIGHSRPLASRTRSADGASAMEALLEAAATVTGRLGPGARRRLAISRCAYILPQHP